MALNPKTVATSAARELGRRLDELWRRSDYQAATFGDAACEVFSASRDLIRELPEQIADWISTTPHYHPELKSSEDIAEPDLIIYSDPHRRFFLELFFWSDHFRTHIHDHTFPAANMLISGESLNVKYEFQPEFSYEEGDIEFGELSIKKTDLLAAGDCYPIAAGSAFIHDVFHVSKKNVSLLAAGVSHPLARPRSYLRPGIATRFRTMTGAHFDKNYLLLKLLTETGADSLPAFESQLLTERPLGESFYQALRPLQKSLANQPLKVRLEKVKKRVESNLRVGQKMEEAAWGVLADHYLNPLHLEDSDARLFLALIFSQGLNNDTRRILRNRFPDQDLLPLVLRWVKLIALRCRLNPTLSAYLIRRVETAMGKENRGEDLENRLNLVDRYALTQWGFYRSNLAGLSGK